MNNSPTLEKQQTWFAHIAEWENTNQSQAAFCKYKSISSIQFGYWRKKYLATQTAEQTESNKFIEVTGKHVMSTSSSITVKCVNGIQLYLPANLPLNQLLSILEFIGLRHV